MSTKFRKKTTTRKSKNLEIDTKAVKILRSLSDEEAFYFYESIGKPTGEIARSLQDFLEKIRSVKLESLLFHLQRKDFQNWIQKTLDDPKLATRIGRIRPSHDDNLRAKIGSIIENRIKELKAASVTLLVDEQLAVLPSSSAS